MDTWRNICSIQRTWLFFKAVQLSTGHCSSTIQWFMTVLTVYVDKNISGELYLLDNNHNLFSKRFIFSFPFFVSKNIYYAFDQASVLSVIDKNVLTKPQQHTVYFQLILDGLENRSSLVTTRGLYVSYRWCWVWIADRLRFISIW